GASFGNVKTDFNVAPIFATGLFNTIAQITPGFGFSNREHPGGFIGGAQIGYNWQYSPLIVVGLEADFQGALERETNNLSSQSNFVGLGGTGCGLGSNTFTTPCTSNTSYTTQIDWFGTVRARIGYVWGDGNVMSYLTGGLAYGEVKINGTNAVSGTVFCDPCAGSGLFSIRTSRTFSQSHVNT